jgi:hypothetical protein
MPSEFAFSLVCSSISRIFFKPVELPMASVVSKSFPVAREYVHTIN